MGYYYCSLVKLCFTLTFLFSGLSIFPTTISYVNHRYILGLLEFEMFKLQDQYMTKHVLTLSGRDIMCKNVRKGGVSLFEIIVLQSVSMLNKSLTFTFLDVLSTLQLLAYKLNDKQPLCRMQKRCKTNSQLCRRSLLTHVGCNPFN